MKIAIDIDDVLAAFTPYAHTRFGVAMEGFVNYWCVDTMDRRLGQGWFCDKIQHDPEFWESLPVLSPAAHIDFDLACYISAFPPKMFATRLNWLDRHGFPRVPLIHSADKVKTCQQLGITHMIDDKPATISALQHTSTVGIHFMAPYAGFEPVGSKIITHLNQVNIYL